MTDPRAGKGAPRRPDAGGGARGPAPRGLGRGLDALLPSAAPAAGASSAPVGVITCPIERIVPKKGQPRQHFDEAELDQLASSIREHGLIEPLVVRKVPSSAADGPHRERFELIAGERRWRAAQRAGLKELLAVVKDISTREAFEMALVENVQRADLDPIELAEAYDRLVKEHGHTPESIAERVSKDRTTVVNSMRLLKLPARIRSMVVHRELSEGHARALLGAPDDKTMNEIADRIVRGRLPVRAAERLVKNARERKKGREGAVESGGREQRSAAIRDLEARLMRRLGTRTEVRDRGGSGELAISYGSLDELDRLLLILGA